MEYFIRRVLLAITTILVVVVLVFLMVRLLPGDASLYRLQDAGVINQEQIDALRAQLNLDKSVPHQFLIWATGVVRGDFGNSFITQQAAGIGLVRGLPVTMELVLLAWGFSIVLGVSMGVIAALRPGGIMDYVARLVAIVGLSVPDFLSATLFILAASLFFHWAPPFGFTSFFESPATNMQQVVPAALVLGFALSGIIMRLTRSSLLEVVRQDYIRTARAKGLSERIVVLRHAMPNGMIPVITVSGTQLGRLLAGSVILETVFSLPGVGSWIVQGITFRDYPVVQAGTLFIATTMVSMNLLVDMAVKWLDPRVRY